MVPVAVQVQAYLHHQMVAVAEIIILLLVHQITMVVAMVIHILVRRQVVVAVAEHVVEVMAEEAEVAEGVADVVNWVIG